jgi:hypothetical protein
VDFDELKWAHEVAKFQFVLTELELAITFAETAASADSDAKATRNIENARRAYKAAMKFSEGARFTPQMTQSIAEKVHQISVLLEHNLPSP